MPAGGARANKGAQPHPVQKKRQRFVALLNVDQRPVYFDSGSNCFPGLQNVGFKAPEWKKSRGPLGEVSFNQIAADAKRIVPGADISPGFTAKEMNGTGQ